MRHNPLVLALCVSALPLAAGAETALVTPDRVLASVTFDIDDDAIPDRALLVDTDEYVDLLVYTGDGTGGMELRATGDGMLWNGGLWGSFPGLDIDEDGRLLAIHQNEAIGRHRWREVFTIGWHGGRVAVTRYGWESYDTLDPAEGRTCEADFLTGEATRDGAALRIPAMPVPIDEWRADERPPFCSD